VIVLEALFGNEIGAAAISILIASFGIQLTILGTLDIEYS
jgi:hypothetical protein